jgi:hypothetical protein
MRCILLILLSGLYFLVGGVYSQNQPGLQRVRREVITVRDSVLGFHREVQEENVAGPYKTYYIPFTSLESIHKVDFTFLDKSGKPVHSKAPEIRDIQVPSMNFYTCLRAKSIELTESSAFRVQYSSDCADLMLLSALYFSGSMPVDTFFYELRLPAGYHLAFDLPNPEMLAYFRIDSIRERKLQIYSITAVPKIKSRPISFRQPEDNLIRKKTCMARIIVTQQQFAGYESIYFNRRLSAMYNNSLQLKDSSIMLIDSLTRNYADKDSVIAQLINFIRKKIKYLDMEVGYGSYIPDEVNKVLKERQGDCKGMSNLLCQALRHKGIDAYLALTASMVHGCDMNFPSIASCDHMICVVKSGKFWTFLDPTDKEGVSGIVSPGIQGRTAFILGYHGGVFVPVPVERPSVNAESFNYRLKLSDNILEGTIDYTAKGASREVACQWLSSTNYSGNELVANYIIRQWIQNLIPSNPQVTQNTDSINLRYDIRFGPSIYIATPGTGYLSLGFLPAPVRFTKQELAGCDILLGHSLLRTVNVVIDFGKNISMLKFPGVEYKEGGFNFDLSCSMEGNYAFIKYRFRYDDNIVSEGCIPMYRKFEAFLDSTLKQVISIK